MILIPNIQKPRPSELPPHQITEHEIQDVQPTESNEAPPVRRLDGEFTKTEDVAFASGAHCEVWKGQWVKGGDVEKVRLRLIMSVPLTWPL